jgi:hypothetical protein
MQIQLSQQQQTRIVGNCVLFSLVHLNRTMVVTSNARAQSDQAGVSGWQCGQIFDGYRGCGTSWQVNRKSTSPQELVANGKELWSVVADVSAKNGRQRKVKRSVQVITLERG